MSKNTTPVASGSAMSFYDKAAWYMLVVPFAAFGLGCLAVVIIEHVSSSHLAQTNAIQVVLTSVLFIEFICFILGMSIGFRIKSHRRKLTNWLALASVLASSGLGCLTLVVLAFSNMGHGC